MEGCSDALAPGTVPVLIPSDEIASVDSNFVCVIVEIALAPCFVTVLVPVVVILPARVLMTEESQPIQGPPGFSPEIVKSVGMEATQVIHGKATGLVVEVRELMYEV